MLISLKEKDASWITFDIPSEFIYSTVFILLSSVTMILANKAIKGGNLKGLTMWSGITMGLGIMFVVFQLLGYQALLSQEIFFTGRDSSSSFSFLYLLTALHMVHLFAGIISLIVVFIKSILGRYSAENKLGVELAAIFWHFLDLLWIYLLLFLLFIR